MRLLPQSLFGRLLLLLMGGLVIAQLLSAAIHLYDRGQILYRTVGMGVAQRVSAIVRLLEMLPDAERQRLVTALDFPPTRIRLNSNWRETSGENHHAEMLASLLRHHLPRDLSLQVAMSSVSNFTPMMHSTHHGMPAHMLYAKRFLVQVKLTDGSVVDFWHQFPQEVFAWPYRLLLILLVLLLSVILVSVLAVRWLIRPLTLLAKAATNLGRDIKRPPLDESGPLEVRRAARAFNTMQTRLARYIEDRSRVLAAVSHDLKTPITRMRLRTEMLKDASLQKKFQADLGEMEAMVRATLDFMRGMEHSETIVPIDIDALLEGLQEDYAEGGGKIQIDGSAHSPFPGRPLALKRCLTNLLDNALHYGKQASVQLADTDQDLVITIHDQGSGIPTADLEHVFEPFYRLEKSRNRHSGGTGLGLGIARNIARAHGGELTLHNAEPGGLEAILSLPR